MPVAPAGNVDMQQAARDVAAAGARASARSNAAGSAGGSSIVAPTMGGVVVLNGKPTPWSGGKPAVGWKGLDSSAPGLSDPNQYRHQKNPEYGYNSRTKGLDSKFAKGKDIKTFANDVRSHVEDHGLDTVLYLPDRITGEMIFVVDGHHRFDSSSARAASKLVRQSFDEYDSMNDSACKKFLLASLSPSMKEDVTDEMERDDTAAVVWLLIIETFKSTSIDIYEDLRDKLKSIKPSQYSGENVDLMVSDQRKITDELEKAGQFEVNLILKMVEAYLEAGGEGNEEFRFPLRQLHRQAKEILREAAFLDKAEAEKRLKAAKLWPKQLYKTVKDEYRAQKDRNRWPPAMSPADRQALPRSVANVAEVPTGGGIASAGITMERPSVRSGPSCPLRGR